MQVKGIDVSYHQGIIDWKKVANAGYKFAIIRAGYGTNTVDNKFIENIVGADTAGLDIGIYWFIYARNVQEAIENADMCDRTLKLYKDIIKMKVWADYEYDSDSYATRTGFKQTKDSRTTIVKAFLERLESKGYEVGVYANPDYLKGKFGDLSAYPLWLAKYSNSMGDYQPYMWQYSSTGAVPGISGNVDLNIFFDNSKEEIEYYPIPEITLIEYLKKIDVDSSYANRKRIAIRNGISDYSGTAEQNLKLLDLLKSGKLIKR